MKKLRNERGAAAVEFALVLPLLVTLVFGSIECGRYFYAKNTLTHASREGVRTLALGGTQALVEARILDTASGLDVDISYPDGFACEAPSPTDLDGKPAKIKTSLDWTFSIPFVTVSVPDVETTAVMRCGG